VLVAYTGNRRGSLIKLATARLGFSASTRRVTPNEALEAAGIVSPQAVPVLLYPASKPYSVLRHLERAHSAARHHGNQGYHISVYDVEQSIKNWEKAHEASQAQGPHYQNNETATSRVEKRPLQPDSRSSFHKLLALCLLAVTAIGGGLAIKNVPSSDALTTFLASSNRSEVSSPPEPTLKAEPRAEWMKRIYLRLVDTQQGSVRHSAPEFFGV